MNKKEALYDEKDYAQYVPTGACGVSNARVSRSKVTWDIVRIKTPKNRSLIIKR